MQTLTIGELKTSFSAVLKRIRAGEEIAISYGKRKEKVAVILPYHRFKRKESRVLGPLQGKAVCIIKDDFKISDEDLGLV